VRRHLLFVSLFPGSIALVQFAHGAAQVVGAADAIPSRKTTKVGVSINQNGKLASLP
jgi:hypothetical protein